MRVTQLSIYRQTLNNINKTMEMESKYSAQASSGKRINQPSDDPVGSVSSIYSTLALSQVTQYNSNVGMAKNWLSQSAASIQDMSDLLTNAKSTANQTSTGTYTSSQLAALSTAVDSYIQEMVTMGNSQVNGDYIFAGTQTDQQAVSMAMTPQNPATPDSGNAGSGTIYGQGTYTGLYSRDITLTVDASYAGGVPSVGNPMKVNYSYVDDYGRTITGSTTLTGVGSGNGVDVGDGVQIYSDGTAYTAGDTYTLSVGRNHGNDEQIYSTLSQANRMSLNYNLNQLWGDEGGVDSEGNRTNVLDQLVGWKDALDKDSKTQTYFEAVPGTTNSPSSSADLRVSGDWDDLKTRDYQFTVGGPVQSSSSSTVLANYRNFTVDAAYTGGVPSASNPMTVDYEYWDGTTWQPQTATITGTGTGNTVTLTGGAVISMVDASYDAGQALPDPQSTTASSFTPSASQPATITYTYVDNNVRKWATVSFTGTGDDSANILDLDPPGNATVRLSSDGKVTNGDTWDLTLQQYNQGQTVSQGMLTTLATKQTDLLKYEGDVGAKLNRIEVRSNLLEADSVRLNSRLSDVESADISEAATALTQYQTLYQAALTSLVMITSHSLADYL